MTYGPPENQPAGPGGQYGGGQHGGGNYGPQPDSGYGQPPAYGPSGSGYGPQPGQQPGQQPPGPQPGGQYGPPSGPYAPAGHAAAKRGLDVGSVNPLDWALLAGGVIALIFSFFQYYTAEFTDRIKNQVCDRSDVPSSVKVGCTGDSASAWHGFFGWFGVVLLLVAALLTALVVFAPHTVNQLPARLVAAVVAGLGAISTLIALWVIPTGDAGDSLAGTGLSLDDVINFGHGFSYWLILIVSVLMTAAAVLRLMQTGGLPGSGAGRQSAPAGAFGSTTAYGQPAAGYGQQPQAGYGPPQQGYSPPGAPPAGYGPAGGQQSGYQPGGYGQQSGYSPPSGYGQPAPPQQPSAQQPSGQQPPAQQPQQPSQQPPPSYGPPSYSSPPPHQPNPGEQPPDQQR